MIYEDRRGYKYKISETLNSKFNKNGIRSYKVCSSGVNDHIWMPVVWDSSLRTRWWRTAEAGEKFLKNFAEKHHWKQVEE